MSKYRRKYHRRGGRVLGLLAAWDESAEPGDFIINSRGELFRVAESRGYYKRMSGELTPVKIKPPVEGATAYTNEKDEIFWEWSDDG